LLWDESADSLIVTGTTTLVGTTNLDAVDIDGATQIDATVTVGVDDTGYDVKFFGATAGAYMLWDESADDLILGGAAGLSVNSTALVTGVLTTTAATVHTGGITMPDNAKAIFGAGSDLEIYHDGSDSYISDQGTGNLTILASAIALNNAANTENMITVIADGAVTLYHDNAAKLATTATGIDVTGTVVADGLTNSGTSQFDASISLGVAGASNGFINSPSGIFVNIDSDNNQTDRFFDIRRNSTDGSGPLIFKAEENGDISFYEDTGTTAKFFWDASAESLGIGTSSPAHVLHLASSAPNLRIEDTDGGYADINVDAGSIELRSDQGNTQATSTLKMFVDGSEAMRIDSSGRVGIGTSSPEALLHVEAADGAVGGAIRYTSTGVASVYMSADGAGLCLATDTAGITFRTGVTGNDPTDTGTERMRIDSEGRLGLGITPSATTAFTVFQNRYLSLYGFDQSQSHIVTNTYYPVDNGDYKRQATGHALKLSMNSGKYIFNLGASGAADSVIAFTEAMTLDATGDVQIGKTDGSQNTVGIILNSYGTIRANSQADIALHLIRSTAGNIARFYYDNTTLVGNISVTASSTAYNTSSDYRLKTDAQPMVGASDRVLALKPVNFEWISSGERVDGFLAHEAQAVVPECVTGTKDGMEDYEITPAVLDDDGNVTTEAVMGTRPVMQGIDQSKLVPLLTAALQEALTKIADMEIRLSALEG
jgi:hypothetical protein